jgi:transketolase
VASALPLRTFLDPPYDVVLKPYGRALVELARERPEIVCLGADLTRQTETDLFRDELPERFINGGMAEANLIGIAGGLARAGYIPFVNTFGVFCTRRCYDQVAMAIAYPAANVKIAGFMPGLSSPGGPSHQATDDIALMRALPNMTVLDLADATEIAQAPAIAASLPGPVYLRLKRGEIPAIFGPSHRLDIERARILTEGADVTMIASGMMVPSALAAERFLSAHGVTSTVVSCPVIKPLDVATIVTAARRGRLVLTAENHSIIGGLGSAVAEALAEAGVSCVLRRIGVRDTFAESGSREFLFEKYGLGVSDLIRAAWDGLNMPEPMPVVPRAAAEPGTYAPV